MAYINGNKVLEIIRTVPTDANAKSTSYDNTNSGLSATNVQDAIDDNSQSISDVTLQLANLNEALYGYVLDSADEEFKELDSAVIPSTITVGGVTYNCSDNVRLGLKEIRGNSKVVDNNLYTTVFKGLKVNGSNLFDGIVSKGTISQTDGTTISANTDVYYSNNFMNVRPNKNYTFSGFNGSYTIRLFNYGINKNYLGTSVINPTDNGKFVTSAFANTYYIKIQFGVSFYTTNIMLVNGSVAPTTYTPYIDPVTLDFTKQILRCVNTAQDTISFVKKDSGLYDVVLTEKIGTVDLNDYLSTFDVNLNAYSGACSQVNIELPYEFTTFISNVLIENNNWVSTLYNAKLQGKVIYFNIPLQTSRENALAFTSNLIIVIQYELATPITTTLMSDLTYKQVTAIAQNGGSIETTLKIFSEYVRPDVVVERVYKKFDTVAQALSEEATTNE